MTKHRGSFWFLTSLLLVVLSGCATVPNGPTVTVLPAPGKPFAQFQDDDAICRQWAAQQIGVTPQETVNQNIATGAVAGSLIGGGLGAAIGSASGHVGTGAAIGAGTGLLLGTLAPIGDMPTAEVPSVGMIPHISSACMRRGTRSQE